MLSSYTANLAAVMVGEKTFEQVSGIHDDKVRLHAKTTKLQQHTCQHAVHIRIVCYVCTQSNLAQGRANEQSVELFLKDYDFPYP